MISTYFSWPIHSLLSLYINLYYSWSSIKSLSILCLIARSHWREKSSTDLLQSTADDNEKLFDAKRAPRVNSHVINKGQDRNEKQQHAWKYDKGIVAGDETRKSKLFRLFESGLNSLKLALLVAHNAVHWRIHWNCHSIHCRRNSKSSADFHWACKSIFVLRYFSIIPHLGQKNRAWFSLEKQSCRWPSILRVSDRLRLNNDEWWLTCNVCSVWMVISCWGDSSTSFFFFRSNSSLAWG